MSESVEALRLIDYVQCVLERPTMYTEHGTYWEVVAFLTGYHAGHRDADTVWCAFLEVLQKAHGDGHEGVLREFRAKEKNDDAALRSLLVLYDGFRVGKTR